MVAVTLLEAPEQPRWSTPDAAVQEAVRSSPLRAQGINYARVPTTGDGAAVALDAISRVLAVLGTFDEREQFVLIAWADRLSYREMARVAEGLDLPRLSATTCRRIRDAAWPVLRDRLVARGLVEGD